MMGLRVAHMSRALCSLGFLVAVLTMNCTFIADAELKAGIGRSCSSSDDCQAAICDRGVCTVRCEHDAECAPSLGRCFDGVCRPGCKADLDCPADSACVDSSCKGVTR